MYGEPAAWERLMDKLVTVQADYLMQQAKAGASALQIFDSWAGLALGREDYLRYVLPYNQKLVELVAQAGGCAGHLLQHRHRHLPGRRRRHRQRCHRRRLAPAAG